VYLEEAHPSDGWQVSSNVNDGLEFPTPGSLKERTELAQLCVARLGFTVPMLIDGLDNAAGTAYNGWPERLYVVSPEGRIAYFGGRDRTDSTRRSWNCFWSRLRVSSGLIREASHCEGLSRGATRFRDASFAPVAIPAGTDPAYRRSTQAGYGSTFGIATAPREHGEKPRGR
jgi:hypothetical protein